MKFKFTTPDPEIFLRAAEILFDSTLLERRPTAPFAMGCCAALAKTAGVLDGRRIAKAKELFERLFLPEYLSTAYWWEWPALVHNFNGEPVLFLDEATEARITALLLASEIAKDMRRAEKRRLARLRRAGK